jgi:hypothetical protein
MQNPPHDSLADYLEAQALLETLYNRKGRLLDAARARTDGAGPPEPLLASVEAGIRKAGALVAQYESLIEGNLQTVADDAESGRTLFLEVSKRIREFCALLGKEAKELGGEERLRWFEVLEDYTRLHAEWIQKLPPEDCPPPIA